jgi:histidine triad (HIT) family protein
MEGCVFCAIVGGRAPAHRLLEDDEHAQVARAAGRVARLLRAALEPAGVNLVHATGVAAWQSVFHFHTHVVPRCRADELQVMWQATPVADADLAAVRARILGSAR